MVSPLIDEDVMFAALKPTATEQLGENAARLRAGASLLMLDAYDRNVTRDQFIATMIPAVAFLDMLSKFEMMNSVKKFELNHGCVTKADIETSLGEIVSHLSTCLQQCTEMAKLIQHCPLDEDQVH